MKANANDYSLKLQNIRDVLKKEVGSRNASDIQFLKSITRHLPIIKLCLEHSDPPSEEPFDILCQNIRYEFKPKDHILYHLGQPVDKSYMIISGTVNLYAKPLPNAAQLQEKQSSNDLQGNYTLKNLHLAKSLGTGQSFGDVLQLRLRQHAAVCAVNTHLLTIDREILLKRVLKHDFHHQGEIAQLALTPLLACLDYIQLRYIRLNCKELSFRQGDAVYQEGARARAVYFVREGQFQAQRCVKRQEIGTQSQLNNG